MADGKAPTQKKPKTELSQAEYRAMYDNTVEELHKQQTQRIRLYQTPEDSSDLPLPDVTVAVNGHVYQLQRGKPLEVPDTVAEILEQAGHI